VKRPPWEVADIIRRSGRRFVDRYRDSLTWPQLKVLRAIERCRTAALGGHRDQCDRCGHQTTVFNSCRDRHCPKCQTNARNRWLAARQRELLPASYYHLVFSVPHTLVPLMWQNKRALFQLLFEASAATLLEVAADPQHLGAEIGFLSVLHTWGQTLQPHPHVHCVVPGGGLSPDHRRWIRSRNHFFLPVKVLSKVFRGKFVAGLRRAFLRNRLHFFGACRPLAHPKAFSAFLRTLFRENWVVYAKKPFGGPEHVLHYLARYTHRVAISNHRLVEVTAERRLVPLERLRAPQQAPHHDALARRVPAAFPAACFAEGLSAHPLLRLARPSPARCSASSLPHVARGRTFARSGNARGHTHLVALSLLSGTHARD